MFPGIYVRCLMFQMKLWTDGKNSFGVVDKHAAVREHRVKRAKHPD